jgi:hypothetical protein
MATYIVVNVMRGSIIGVRLMAHAFQAAEEARRLIEKPGYDEAKDAVQVFRMVHGVGEPLLRGADVKAILLEAPLHEAEQGCRT